MRTLDIVLEAQCEQTGVGLNREEDGENQGACFEIQRREDGVQTRIVQWGWREVKELERLGYLGRRMT